MRISLQSLFRLDARPNTRKSQYRRRVRRLRRYGPSLHHVPRRTATRGSDRALGLGPGAHSGSVVRARRIDGRHRKIWLDRLREGKRPLLSTERLARGHEQAHERHDQRERARPREQLASGMLDEVYRHAASTATRAAVSVEATRRAGCSPLTTRSWTSKGSRTTRNPWSSNVTCSSMVRSGVSRITTGTSGATASNRFASSPAGIVTRSEETMISDTGVSSKRRRPSQTAPVMRTAMPCSTHLRPTDSVSERFPSIINTRVMEFLSVGVDFRNLA